MMQPDVHEDERPRVLCVDDEPLVLHTIERTLRFEFEVISVANARDAIEALSCRGPFAVVVSDLSMPVMGGAALLGEMGRRSPDTVQLLLTGRSDVKAAAEAVNAGQVF